jgi:hypothetical protein
MLGEYKAHVLNTVTIMAVVLLGSFLFLNNFGFETTRGDLILIGFLWVGLTVFFELIFFHYILKEPWSDLLADYNVFRGRLWTLVLLTMLFSPLIVGTAI